VPAIGAADIQATFATSYEATAATLLAVPMLLGLVLEPWLFVLADRMPRRWFVCGGLGAMAASAFVAAAAPSAWVLAGAASVAYVAAGIGVALGQATLADENPATCEQVMTRWTMLGVVGDLAAPAMFAALGALSLGWRTGYVIAGVALAAITLAVATRRFPAPVREPDEDEPGVIAAILDALGTPGLIGWLIAHWLCDLLDEILVVFAALHLRDDLGAGVGLRSVALGGFVAGGALGLAVADRLLRRIAPLRLLTISALTCAVAYGAWLAASSVPVAIAALFVTGAAAAPLYPIVAAQTYATLPGRSGTIHAAAHVTTPLALATPWLLGVVADRVGALGALALLTAAPLGIAAIALRSARLRMREEARNVSHQSLG